MAKYNVHAGHCPQGKGASGAVGILKESVEDRLVKNEVIRVLREEGHTAYDCTCEENTTQNGCLEKIVAKCNAHNVVLDVSIHLNSGRKDKKGDGKTGGVEVFCYDKGTIDVAKRIVDNIAKEFGYALRSDSTTPEGYAGVKITKNLYVLNNTKADAILVECCFVDDADDAEVWDPVKCGQAIAAGILKKKISGNSNVSKPSATKPSSGKKDLGNVDLCYAVYAGGKWWPEVKNKTNWAGKADGVPIKYLGLRVSKGSIRGRVWTKKKGDWLPYITFKNSYNTKDLKNGVLGDGSDILGIELYYYTPDGYLYKEVHYRVSVSGTDQYYAVQVDDKEQKGMDGYAGDLKRFVDKFQAWIE